MRVTRLALTVALAAGLAATVFHVGCRKESGGARAAQQMKSGGLNVSGGQAPKAGAKVGKGDPTAVSDPGTIPEEALRKMGKR